MSEFGGRRPGIGDREDHLDLAIDRAVREMLDVEPPPGLRGRVIDRIELSSNSLASAFRRKIFWIAAPIAAAAILVLAVLLPSKTPATVGNPERTVATTQPRPAAGTAPSTIAAVTSQAVAARTATRRPRARPGVRAAVADEVTAEAEIVWVDPLAVPAPVAVPAIEPGRGDTIQSIDLAPREIPALEIRPISDTPRERRNQE
jgi:hypothetical protein